MSKLYRTCCSLTLIMLLSITTLFAQQTVTGRVTDANGALARVTVSVVGTSTATPTDANGNYTIQANDGSRLRFTILGYLTHELIVAGGGYIMSLLKKIWLRWTKWWSQRWGSKEKRNRWGIRFKK